MWWLFACAHRPSVAAYEAFVAPWVGQDVRALAEAWGPPARVEEGRLVYAEEVRWYRAPPSAGEGYRWSNEATVVYRADGLWLRVSCETAFETDAAGVITRVESFGNGCVR